jgi:hypothetical protein
MPLFLVTLTTTIDRIFEVDAESEEDAEVSWREGHLVKEEQYREVTAVKRMEK